MIFFTNYIKEALNNEIGEKTSHSFQARAFSVLDKVLPNSRRFRRGEVYPHSFRLLGPSELEDTSGTGCEDLINLLEDDYGVVIIHNHLSMRDSFEPPRHLFERIPQMREIPMIYAISQHNHNERSEAFSRLFGTDLGIVITRHSAQVDPTLGDKEGYGKVSFAKRALEILHPSLENQRKGVRPGAVIIASTPWRQDFLGEPLMKTVEEFGRTVTREQARQAEKRSLEQKLRIGGLTYQEQLRLYGLQKPQIFPDKIAVVFFGIGIEGVHLYKQSITGGWNPGEKYNVKMSKVYKIEDLLEQARLVGRTPDEYGFDILRTLVPPEYGDPKARDQAKIQLAGQRSDGVSVFDPLIDFLRFPRASSLRFSF